LQQNAEKFHELEVATKGFGLNFKEFFVGALEGVAPTATSIADALGSIDFVGIGKAVGEMLNVFLQLGKILLWFAPIVDAVSRALEHLNGATVGGALAGALVGTFAAGPVGTVVGGLTGGFLGSHFGSEPEHHKGFAEAFRGLQQSENEAKPVAGALQKIG